MLELMLSLANTKSSTEVHEIFNTVGTFTWICPAGVTSVNCLLISPGQSSFYTVSTKEHIGGAGGGLRYQNNIPVEPGTSYTVVVGVTKQNGDKPATDNPCSALGLMVMSGSQGTPFSSTVKGGRGGSSVRTAASAFNDGGTPGANSGLFTNGTSTPGDSATTLWGGLGVNYITGQRTNTTTKDGATYGGGGGGQSGKGGDGIVVISNTRVFG